MRCDALCHSSFGLRRLVSESDTVRGAEGEMWVCFKYYRPPTTQHATCPSQPGHHCRISVSAEKLAFTRATMVLTRYQSVMRRRECREMSNSGAATSRAIASSCRGRRSLAGLHVSPRLYNRLALSSCLTGHPEAYRQCDVLKRGQNSEFSPAETVKKMPRGTESANGLSAPCPGRLCSKRGYGGRSHRCRSQKNAGARACVQGLMRSSVTLLALDSRKFSGSPRHTGQPASQPASRFVLTTGPW